MAILGRKDKTPLGIYIHVPFCRSKCQYCDFYSLTTKDDRLLDGFLDAVCAHIKEAGALAPGYSVDTVYFGGGTPSFFGADGMATILTAVRRSFDVSNNAEITFEANPDSVSPKLLHKLHSEGFNRVSLGIQCDNDEILDKIGRPHNYAQAVSAVKQIRRAGFRNLSLDLIYGLPGQTVGSWERTLQNVLKLEPEHISCYGLKVEEGTPLHRYQEFLNLPDDDMQADMYLRAVEVLRSKGFRQYEISNFCRRNNESKHNLKYWTGGEYLGFGPDASSDFAGKRFKMIRDLRGYIDGVLGGGQVIDDLQEIPQRERAGEYLMMRLRTNLGISAQEYEKQYLLPFAPLEKALEQCAKRGHAVKLESGHWRLTPEGFLISNSIISDLLVIQDKAAPLAKRR
ncbi:MAG: radical SAM family heme chaperone HemW [Oscillospiraceae bacterium]|nr:radical SAM family heme chaperone HemW [Oscillospiraceae bacterium]MBQ8769528.1 radical SAM family heme chaperone HemW [Oscillospiraceae bacterium]